MDLNNLLPDAGTRGCGYNANQFYEHYTNTLTDVSDSYFLGYVAPTEVPSTAFPTKPSYNSETDEILFDSVSKNNAAVGYVRGNNTEWISNAFKFSDGTNTFSHQLSYIRYLNNFYPEFFSFGEKIRIYFYYFLYRPDGTLHSFSHNFFQIDGYSNINRFFENYTSVSIPMYLNPTKYFSFKFEDLVSGNGTVYIEEDTASETKWALRIFAARVGYAGGTYYNGGNYGVSGYGFNIKTFGTFSDGTNGYLYSLGDCIGSASLSDRIAAFYLPTSTLFINTTYGRGSGCFNSVIFTGSALPTVADGFIYDDGILAHNTGGSNVEFLSYISNPLSIKSMWSLCFRINPGGVASYVTGMSYATDVNGSEFESTLKTGDIYDAVFKSGLEHWQYVDVETYDPITNPQGVAVNEFTEEDIPPYDPTPTPTPGEGNNPDNPELTLSINNDTPEDDIDDETYLLTPIDFPISSFMTQYILNAQDVYDMGLTLWSGLGDPNSNMIANIARVYGSTGTFNIANIMDLFLSVKAFPFDLRDFNYMIPAPAMTVGTGAVPILNREVPVFTASTYTLDCGTVSTVQKGVYRFGSDYDFRNYVNTAISCFLPFCGTVELDPSDVFPYDLHCIYFIDMISGSCTACVYVLRDGSELLVGSKTGQIGKIVPISANNLMGVVGAALSDVTAIAQTIGQTILNAAEKKALGSSQMPVNEASKNSDYLKQVASYKENQQRISGGYDSMRSAYNTTGSATQGISNVMTRNGVSNPSLSPGTGLEALNVCRRPYITIRKLKYSSPNNYAHTTGFKCTDGTERKTISSYKGYTVFQNVDLSGIVATQEELDEIKALLETGVYL